MSLPEKVNITTGTGWQMGLCVGNTGKAGSTIISAPWHTLILIYLL
jgi:hypothetical protein